MRRCEILPGLTLGVRSRRLRRRLRELCEKRLAERLQVVRLAAGDQCVGSVLADTRPFVDPGATRIDLANDLVHGKRVGLVEMVEGLDPPGLRRHEDRVVARVDDRLPGVGSFDPFDALGAVSSSRPPEARVSPWKTALPRTSRTAGSAPRSCLWPGGVNARRGPACGASIHWGRARAAGVQRPLRQLVAGPGSGALLL
jgi:hypothetical protein